MCLNISLGFDLNFGFQLWVFESFLFRPRDLGVSESFLKVVVGYFVGIRCEFVTPPTLHSCHTASKTQPSGFLGKWISALKNCIQNPVSCTRWSCSILISIFNNSYTENMVKGADDLWRKKTAAAMSGGRKVFRRPGLLAAQILTLRCHPFKTTFCPGDLSGILHFDTILVPPTYLRPRAQQTSTQLHYIFVFSGCWKYRWSMQIAEVQV